MEYLTLFAIAVCGSLWCAQGAYPRTPPLPYKLPQEDADFSKEAGWQIPDLLLHSKKFVHPNYINEYNDAKNEWLAKRKS